MARMGHNASVAQWQSIWFTPSSAGVRVPLEALVRKDHPPLAQSAARRTVNAKVPGSNPGWRAQHKSGHPATTRVRQGGDPPPTCLRGPKETTDDYGSSDRGSIPREGADYRFSWNRSYRFSCRRRSSSEEELQPPTLKVGGSNPSCGTEKILASLAQRKRVSLRRRRSQVRSLRGAHGSSAHRQALHTPLVQLAEHPSLERGVPGSNPGWSAVGWPRG